MKTAKLTLALIIAVTAAFGVFADTADMLIKLRALNPKEDMDWASASGVEFQARFWGSDRVGIALAMGVENWGAQSEFTEEEDAFSYMSTSISGAATTVPMGISALFVPAHGRTWAMILDLGFRYAVTDSRVESEIWYEDAEGFDYLREPIEIGNAFLGVMGISMEANLGDGISIQGGVGYQFDLIEPEETFLGESIGSSSFSAASFNVGVAFEF